MMNASSPSTIIPGIRYRDAEAAIDWLTRVLGFTAQLVIREEDGSIAHAQLTLDGGMLMLGSKRDDEYHNFFSAPDELGGKATQANYIPSADIDAAYARAQAEGAHILHPLKETHYGSRDFSVQDPEGHIWFLGSFNPWVPPAA